MIRTQIQITPEQARALKRLAAREGKSVAELIRMSVDSMLRTGGIKDQDDLRCKAIAAAGKLNGPENLAVKHDDFLAEALDRRVSLLTQPLSWQFSTPMTSLTLWPGIPGEKSSHQTQSCLAVTTSSLKRPPCSSIALASKPCGCLKAMSYP